MTEGSWLAGELSFEDVLGRDDFPLSERQRLLFAAACVRQAWRLLIDERCRKAVEALERHADGLASVAEVQRAWAGAWEVRALNVAGPADVAAELAARVPLSHQSVDLPARLVRAALAREYAWRQAQGLPVEADLDVERQARAAQEHLFRDIVGNPFRPRRVNPAWLTLNGGFVAWLAEDIYQRRRFADLPVLADALEDAGCDAAELLEHCRRQGPHVRGCWALDALTGRA